MLDEVPKGARILVVRQRSLGDCVLTTPALELLKRARPDVEIGVVVEDRFAAVFEGHPAVSALFAPEHSVIRRFRPWLCVNLHGGTRSMLLTLASGARVRSGFAHHRGSVLYNVKIPRAQEILGVQRTVHTAEHLASAMFFLGVPASEIPRSSLFADPGEIARPYAVIHPVAAATYKTWRPQGFLAVAEYLQQNLKLEPVFIGTGADDLAPFARYRVVRGVPLAPVKTLIKNASMFVGNDSGPAHIAAAFDVPLVVLFGRLDHQVVWAPWKATSARTLASPGGISAIGTEDVIAAIAELK